MKLYNKTCFNKHISQGLSLSIKKKDEKDLLIFRRKILDGVHENDVWRRRSNQKLGNLYKEPDVVKIIRLNRLS